MGDRRRSGPHLQRSVGRVRSPSGPFRSQLGDLPLPDESRALSEVNKSDRREPLLPEIHGEAPLQKGDPSSGHITRCVLPEP